METAIFLAFLGAMACVGIWFVRTIAYLWDHRKTYKAKPLDMLAIALGLLGLACIIYGVFEPLRLETTFRNIKSAKVQGQPIRIVHLTDMHCDGTIRTETSLPAVVAELRPDLILFTGDAADTAEGLRDFQTCMSKISKIAPTFGVLGNHDTRKGYKVDVFNGTGVTNLDCESRTLDVKGNQVWVCGSAVDSKGFVADTLTRKPEQALSIFMHHYPDAIGLASANQIDLFLAGHTHGGQIRLPWYGALVTASPSGKLFEYGLYTVGKTTMNVSRGIGMTGIPVRFLAPPEVAVIDVEAETPATSDVQRGRQK